MKTVLLLGFLGLVLAASAQAGGVSYIRAVAPEPDFSDPATLLAAEEYVRLASSMNSRQTQRCGVPNKGGKTRIIGGHEVDALEYPWQIALVVRVQYNETTQAGGFCGGTLISDQWVLTAAHCVDLPYPVLSTTVYVGAHDLSLSREEDGRTEIVGESWYTHPEWDSSTVKNDVALIKLSQPVTFDDTICPICMGYGGDIEKIDVEAIGWGKTSDAGGRADTLQRIHTTTMTNSACRMADFVFFLLVSSNHVCIETHGGAKSVCNGDSGGPLLRWDGDRYSQIGVVSFGSSKGCESGSPAVFSRVDKYHSFICGTSGVC
jgi:secreted trypsin-like serine protease